MENIMKTTQPRSQAKDQAASEDLPEEALEVAQVAEPTSGQDSAEDQPTTEENEKEEDERDEDKSGPSSSAASSAPDTADNDTAQPQGQFQRPRPVDEYLKEDDSLPGWLWTAGGVALIAGLDAADDNWNSDDESGPASNRAPRFNEEGPKELSVDEDNSVTFTVDASDKEGDELIFSSSSLQNGSIEQGENDNEFIYTPNENFTGEETFTLGVRDASNPSSDETLEVIITVNPVNDAPELDDEQTVETGENTAITFDVEATDVDSEGLTYTVAEGENAPQFGEVTSGNEPGEFVYTPSTDFVGFDSFDIIVSDGEAESTQTIFITVGEPATYQLSVADPELREGNEGSSQMVFTLVLDKPVENQDLVISVTQNGGSADGQEDYSAPASITVPVGESEVAYIVDILGDTSSEENETLELIFSNFLLNEEISATGTIINDDPGVVIELNENSDLGSDSDDAITSSDELTFTITTVNNALVEVYDGDELLGQATAVAGQPGSYSLTSSDLEEGEHQIKAVVTPDGGLPAESTPIIVNIDRSEPTLDSLSATAESNTATITFSEDVDILDATGITFTQNENSIDAVLDSIDGNTAVFSFSSDIVDGDLIDLAIAENSIADIAGNHLPEILTTDDPSAVTA